MVKHRYLRSIGSLLLLWLVLTVTSVNGAGADTATPAGDSLADVSLAQSICAPVALLQDGGFEAGLSNPPWQTSSNVFSTILDDTVAPAPRTGTWKAWLGGDNLVQESLWETINVPAGIAGLKVSYWSRVDTFETNHPFDSMNVQIRNAAGKPLQTLETLTDGNASLTWQKSSFTVTGYAGQTIQLAFAAQTDSTNPTSFFVDDVNVYKTCPAGLAGDVTGDCKVNIIDVQEAAAHWGQSRGSTCYAEPYDQDSNGTINAADLQQMAGQWRQTAP
jgi:hypothetical protein